MRLPRQLGDSSFRENPNMIRKQLQWVNAMTADFQWSPRTFPESYAILADPS